MAESTQAKLGRVRPPRVQITYDVEKGDAIESKELPFVVGILADLSGSPKEPLPILRDRKFIEIDRDNFDQVLAAANVRRVVKVDNQVPDSKGKIEGSVSAELTFSKIEDFEPVPLLAQIDPLAALYRSRVLLKDFLAKLDGNDALDGLLTKLLYPDTLQADEDASDDEKKAIDEEKEAVVKLKSDLASDYVELGEKLQANLEKAKMKHFPEKLQKEIMTALGKEKLELADLDDETLAKNLPTEYFEQLTTLKEDLVKLDSWKKVDASDPKWEDEWQALWNDVKLSESFTKVIDGPIAHDKSQFKYAAILLGEFVEAILNKIKPADEKTASDKPLTDAAGLTNNHIANTDEIISRQLNLIIHDKNLQTLEATWRGLHYLVMNTETSTQLKLRVLNATRDDLIKDISKAVEFDQSVLFKLIYEKEYGTYGGNPYSVLIGDYQFGRSPTDMELLQGIAGVASAAHAPFIAAAYAEMFDLDDFSKLYKPRDLSKIFESAELIKWRSFRDSEDSRYVTLTLPRVLLRLPYGKDTIPVEGFDFEEDTDGSEAKKYLWGNPAFILGQRITNAFSLYGWTAAIRGVEGGGLVEGLPAHTFKTTEGDIELTCPTEVAITDRREKELNDLGFMAICHCKGTDKAAFFGGQTANLPKKYNTDQANANSRISAMLPYILAASRFAHYIKVIMREKVGKFMTRGNVEEFLNIWISQYVLLDDSPPQSVKARYPLREGRVDVFDVPGKPGAYRAVVYLKPHFQLEELTTSIRLVAELPA